MYVAFVIGPQHWSISLWLAVATVNYIYKLTAAIILTPLLYVVHALIDRYLGEELSLKLRKDAMEN
ncbi:MAG: hypothetical protein ABR94_00580 [Sphingobacteriales bacterium BACL12 MAG-120802-bin5]|nr:MAG: hypothetical protein ABR94_00580 [Sphingobacteriales bacterium BACL12 MAG-120802-bin5]